MIRRRARGSFDVAGPQRRDGRALTAAVTVLQGYDRRVERFSLARRTYTVSRAWQAEAWALYEEIGELRAALSWMANAISRCVLYAGRIEQGADDPERVESGPALELMESLAGGPIGQAQLLHRAGLHLSLVGDTYIVGRTTEVDPGDDVLSESWMACSTDEVSHSAGKWSVDDGSGKVTLSDTDVIFRCHIPHPRRWQEPDSSVLSSLPVLRELRGLTQHVSAQIDSRLAGAGLLFLPDSITPPGSIGQASDDNDGENPFMRALMDYMITPIKDRDHASAVVPLIMQGPVEAGEGIKYFTFATPLDEKAKDLRDEAIRRWSISADMPPEVLLGLSDSNHWNAFKISDEAITLHVEPVVAIIAASLTIGFLRPALVASGMSVDEANAHVVWFDTTRLTQRPDRSQQAVELYDRAEIGADALRRETGFDGSDAPTGDELTRLLALRIIREVPALAPALVGLIGIPQLDASQIGNTQSEDTSGTDSQSSDDSAPDDDARDGVDDRAARLSTVTLGAHLAVLHALERAGARILVDRSLRAAHQNTARHTIHQYAPVMGSEIARVLDDGAWTLLADALAGCPGAVEPVKDYVRELVSSGEAHDVRYLRPILRRCGCG